MGLFVAAPCGPLMTRRMPGSVRLVTVLNAPLPDTCSRHPGGRSPMREIILAFFVALVMTAGVTAAWYITQPVAATYVR